MPVIDVHAHWGDYPYAVPRTRLEDLTAMLGKFNIERVVLASTLAITCDFRRGNAELHQVLEGQPHMLGYVTLNAHYPDESLEEARRYLDRPHFVGTQFHPTYAGQRITSEGSQRILTGLRRYGKPVYVATSSEQDVRDAVEIAQAYSTLKIILGQMGGEAWETAIRASAEVLNAYLEIGAKQAHRDKIKEALGEVGAKRIVFGSNMSLLHPAYVAGMVREAALSNAERDRIFYRNAQELLALA